VQSLITIGCELTNP